MRAGARRFRRQVLEQFGGRPGRGCRYPEALRCEAVALARSAFSEGLGLASTAEELGIRASTLSRWLKQSPATGALRPVEVVSDQEEVVNASSSGVVLVTPSGIRIEGLRAEEVAALLRVLG